MIDQLPPFLTNVSTWVATSFAFLFLLICLLLINRKLKLNLIDSLRLTKTTRMQQQFSIEQLEQTNQKQQIRNNELEQISIKLQQQNQEFRQKLLKLKSLYDDHATKLSMTTEQLAHQEHYQQSFLEEKENEYKNRLLEKDKKIEDLLVADSMREHQIIHQKAQVNYHHQASVRYQRLFQLSEDKYSDLKMLVSYLPDQLDDYDEQMKSQKIDEVMLAKWARLISPIRRQINKINTLVLQTPSALEDLKEQERLELIRLEESARLSEQEQDLIAQAQIEQEKIEQEQMRDSSEVISEEVSEGDTEELLEDYSEEVLEDYPLEHDDQPANLDLIDTELSEPLVESVENESNSEAADSLESLQDDVQVDLDEPAPQNREENREEQQDQDYTTTEASDTQDPYNEGSSVLSSNRDDLNTQNETAEYSTTADLNIKVFQADLSEAKEINIVDSHIENSNYLEPISFVDDDKNYDMTFLVEDSFGGASNKTEEDEQIENGSYESADEWVTSAHIKNHIIS